MRNGPVVPATAPRPHSSGEPETHEKLAGGAANREAVNGTTGPLQSHPPPWEGREKFIASPVTTDTGHRIRPGHA